MDVSEKAYEPEDGGDVSRDEATETQNDLRRRLETVEQQIDADLERAKERVDERLDEGIARTSARLDSAAGRLREAGESSGSEATLKLAEDVETAAAYLKDKSVEDIVKDVEIYMKEHPTQALLGAVLAGIVVGRILR